MNHGLSLLEPQSDVFDVKHMNPERKSAIIREAKTIMEKVSRVRYEMGRDYPMPCVESTCLGDLVRVTYDGFVQRD